MLCGGLSLSAFQLQFLRRDLAEEVDCRDFAKSFAAGVGCCIGGDRLLVRLVSSLIHSSIEG